MILIDVIPGLICCPKERRACSLQIDHVHAPEGTCPNGRESMNREAC
ncbi:MAG: hypothetical protein K2P87_06865 [Lachnospiraceae bacterium]|nr:hypothetical protein [Lachnospiraceae bacterium]